MRYGDSGWRRREARLVQIGCHPLGRGDFNCHQCVTWGDAYRPRCPVTKNQRVGVNGHRNASTAVLNSKQHDSANRKRDAGVCGDGVRADVGVGRRVKYLPASVADNQRVIGGLNILWVVNSRADCGDLDCAVRVLKPASGTLNYANNRQFFAWGQSADAKTAVKRDVAARVYRNGQFLHHACARRVAAQHFTGSSRQCVFIVPVGRLNERRVAAISLGGLKRMFEAYGHYIGPSGDMKGCCGASGISPGCSGCSGI